MDGQLFLSDIVKQYTYYKYLAERAMDQVDDESFFVQQSDSVNSIAITVKHIAGNLLSRFQDFQTTDGEKSWRNRDEEFVIHEMNRADLMEIWTIAWTVLFRELNGLDGDNMTDTILIRNQKHFISTALMRSLSHVSYHVGQIVQEAKRINGDHWKSLSIPKGKSAEFNDLMLMNKKGNQGEHYTDSIMK